MGLECKSRKLGNTWNNRQIWPWSTEWSRVKDNRVLPRECTGHSKHPLPTTQEKTLHIDMTRWPTPKSDWYILWSQRWRSCIRSAKTRPRADCGSDHELLIAKLRLKLKKVGKTTRPFRNGLNQIPYDYTVEVTNWFKELDLINRVPDELWTEVCDIVQETGIKTILRKINEKKAKWLPEEALQIAVKRREAKSKGEKERYSHLKAKFQSIARRERKSLPQRSMERNRGKQ